MGDNLHGEQRSAGKICEMLWLFYSQAEASHGLASKVRGHIKPHIIA